MAAQRRLTGPGIAKVRSPSPLTERALTLTRAADPLWRMLLEQADVVSEGAAAVEGDKIVYRGMTSILVPDDKHGGMIEARHITALAAVAALDPHCRARVLRIARREAAARAPGGLASANMELTVRTHAHGLAFDVDLDVEVTGLRRRVKG